MLVFMLSYIVSALITFIILQKFKYKTFPLPKLKLSKSGISFYSTKKHKIKVENLKIISISNGVCVKTEKEIIVFKNVKNVILRNEYMYFCCCGKVDIVFNALNYYRYFNFKIVSKDFNFEEFKQLALLDLINCNFNFEKAENFKKFINFIKNTLKIDINEEKIKFSTKLIPFSYQIVYRLNNKIKRINVSNTIGKS